MDASIGGCKVQGLLHKVYNVCLAGFQGTVVCVGTPSKGDPISTAVCYTTSYSDSQEIGFGDLGFRLSEAPKYLSQTLARLLFAYNGAFMGLLVLGGMLKLRGKF